MERLVTASPESFDIVLFDVLLQLVGHLGYLHKWLHQMMKRQFAFLMDTLFVPTYNELLGSKKSDLFESMGKVIERVGGGAVLEIGAGSGANFKYYPSEMDLIALEPNRNFESYLRKNLEDYPDIKLKDFLVDSAEDMKRIPNDSISCVVCTLVLCSVDSIDDVLSEVKRILKPGGRFYFLEHTAAKRNTWLNWFQEKLLPLWGVISDGCDVTRRTWKSLRKAGFSQLKINRFDAPMDGLYVLLKPHIIGYADK